jgi:hypothetical protein
VGDHAGTGSEFHSASCLIDIGLKRRGREADYFFI